MKTMALWSNSEPGRPHFCWRTSEDFDVQYGVVVFPTHMRGYKIDIDSSRAARLSGYIRPICGILVRHLEDAEYVCTTAQTWADVVRAIPELIDVDIKIIDPRLVDVPQGACIADTALAAARVG